jgi:hypothetical protein
VPRLLSFVLHNKSGRAAIAALREKYEEDHGEESATIILAGRLKILRKLRKQSSNGGSEIEARWPRGLDIPQNYSA